MSLSWLVRSSTTTTLLVITLLGRNAQSFHHAPLFVQAHNRFSSSQSSSTKRFMSSTPKKRVLVPIGNGSEEIETTCITDTLVRFGAEVVVASVSPDGELKCKMSRGIHFLADTTISEASKEEWDLIALPGGMPGAEHLRDCAPLISLLQTQASQDKLYGAICASPAVVLASKKLIKPGATCYPAPGFQEQIENWNEEEVVVQDNLITSKGPGTALKFALALGEKLFGKEKADNIAKEMLVER